MKQSQIILVVDDDKTARYGVRRALEERYQILEAESGRSAPRARRRESRPAPAGYQDARGERARLPAGAEGQGRVSCRHHDHRLRLGENRRRGDEERRLRLSPETVRGG